MSLALTILQILDLANGFMVPQATVAAEVRLRGIDATDSQVGRELQKLDTDKDAVGVANQDAPGGAKWKITDKGKARLAEAGL